jgi:DNA-binding SARP family transcriptional activator
MALLGGFQVTVRSGVVPDEAWRLRRPAALLKLLALAPGHRLHREQLMDALWPELAPDAAAANLRKALHHARRTLGSELVVSTGEVLALPSNRLWVDVDAFRAAAFAARRASDPAAYEVALQLYRGDLLPEDRYEEWTIAHRDELHGELVSLLEELAGLLEAAGELDDAIRVAGRLASAEPLREDAHLRLVRLYALEGRRAEAMRRYDEMRTLLDRELGVEPSADAQKLYEEVRAGLAEPELTADLWERVGNLRLASGDARGAVKAFSQALDAGGPAASRGRLHRGAATGWLMQHDPDGAESHLVAAEAVTAEPADRGRLLCLRSNQAWERGDFPAALAAAEEARDLALSDGNADDLAAAQEALAIVSHFRGEWRRGLELEVQRLAQEGSSAIPPGRVFEIHHCIGQYHLYGDGLADDVEAYARRVLDQAERAEAVRAQAFAWCLLGESLLLHARWDEAAGCLERSCELHASLGSRSGSLPWQRLAELAVCTGRPEEAEHHLRHATAIATVSPMAMHMWGRIYATAAFAHLERGHLDAAARAVRSADAAAARYGSCPSCSALLNPVAAEVFGALDDRNAAHAYADAAAGVAGFFDSSAWRAMAESAAASAAAADADTRLAGEKFTAAAALYERAGQPYWQERAVAYAGSASRT